MLRHMREAYAACGVGSRRAGLLRRHRRRVGLRGRDRSVPPRRGGQARVRPRTRRALRARRLPRPPGPGRRAGLAPGGQPRRACFDVRLMRDLVVITAAGVGGGSLVYANVQLRAPASVFDDPRWPAAIDAATLEPWYLRTEDALQPRTTPAEPPLRKVAAFAAAGARAGREATPLPLAVHFGEPASTRSAAHRRRAARTSRAATSGAPCTRRTRSTSRTSRGRRRTARPSCRCTRPSASSRPTATAGSGASASNAWTAAGPAPSARRSSCSPPARSGRRGSCSRTAVACPACPPRWAPASRATATRWASRSIPPRPTSATPRTTSAR